MQVLWEQGSWLTSGPLQSREVARQSGQGSKALRARTVGLWSLWAKCVPSFGLLPHSSFWSICFQNSHTLWPLSGKLSTHMTALGSRV